MFAGRLQRLPTAHELLFLFDDDGGGDEASFWERRWTALKDGFGLLSLLSIGDIQKS